MVCKLYEAVNHLKNNKYYMYFFLIHLIFYILRSFDFRACVTSVMSFTEFYITQLI